MGRLRGGEGGQGGETASLGRAVNARPPFVKDEDHAPRVREGEARDDGRRRIVQAAPVAQTASAVKDEPASGEGSEADAGAVAAVKRSRRGRRIEDASV